MKTKVNLELFEAIAVVLMSKDGFVASVLDVAKIIVEKGLYRYSAKKIEKIIQEGLVENSAGSEISRLFKLDNEGRICIRELVDSDITSIKRENDFLKKENKGLRFQLGINKTLLGFHEGTFASAAADLLINPSPIRVHATEKGKGFNYQVSLNDVLVIESKRRIKNIFLKKKVIPEEGGRAIAKISDNIGFERLLIKLQGKGHHLMRVHDKYAINIYHYILSEKGKFQLSESLREIAPKEIWRIKTGKVFDKHLYHTRLMQIDRLSKSQDEFSLHLSKIEEINRYKNR